MNAWICLVFMLWENLPQVNRNSQVSGTGSSQIPTSLLQVTKNNSLCFRYSLHVPPRMSCVSLNHWCCTCTSPCNESTGHLPSSLNLPMILEWNKKWLQNFKCTKVFIYTWIMTPKSLRVRSGKEINYQIYKGWEYFVKNWFIMSSQCSCQKEHFSNQPDSPRSDMWCQTS